MKTALITAAGSAAARTVLESLKKQGMRVVACDIYPREWNDACMQADAFFQAEKAADEQAYLRQMEWAVREYGLTYLIPLTDVEVDVLCAHKQSFESMGCTLCVLDEAVTRLCRNKLAMAKQLEGVCQTIPTYAADKWQPTQSDMPLMLKPVSGRSSQGQQIIDNISQALTIFAKKLEGYIAQPYIPGDIYTVDVARDAHGNVQTLVRQELLRTTNGLGTTVHIFPEHPLNHACAQIAKHVGIVGVVNMEFIEHEGQHYFLEVNPRFSGGLGFSVTAGVDFPALMITCYTGKAMPKRAVVEEMTLTRQVKVIRSK